MVGRTTIEPTILSPSGIDLRLLDLDAVRATQRLSQRGFDAFLVGGCVRDLLLGRTPKDYDIATEARPPQVKRTFPRNCRIIGRRFKLAHLHFDNNRKILEVSTFRRTPQMDNAEDDLLITRDNEFGTAEEDALRRDFTVNALFLDPIQNRILDFANGLEDVRAQVIRTIGDPVVRFREDPVRILRAAKFAGRLGFHIEPGTLQAMAETAPDLMRAAPPRLLEEIQRLLRGGHALDSFQLLRDIGALKTLLPPVAEFLAEAPQAHRVHFWRLLDALDHRVQGGVLLPNPVLLSVLFAGPVALWCERQPDRSPTSIAEELLGPLSQTLRLPRRDAGCLKRVCSVQHRFLLADAEKRFKLQGFLHGPYFAEALDLFALRAMAEGLDPALLRQWEDFAVEARVRGFQRDGGYRDEAQPREAWPDDEPSATTDQDGPTPQDRDAQPDDAGPQDAEGSHDGDDAAERDSGDGTPVPGHPFDIDQDGGGRRRRRRRGRRGRGRHRYEDEIARQEGGGPPSETDARGDGETSRRHPTEPAPSGTGLPADGGEPAGGDPRDSGFPAAGDTSEGDAGDGDYEGSEPSGDGMSVPAEAQPGQRGPDRPFGEGGRRRRRRRRRRGRGGQSQFGDQPFPPSGPPQPHGDPMPSQAGDDSGAVAAELPGEAQPQRPQHGRPQQHQQPHHHQRQQQQGRHQHGQQQQQQQQGDGDRRGRRRRGRDRDRDRDRGRDHHRPRDVDVVPRHIDRRGKVDVIEPPPLDLSAFDAELGTKAVPTFGALVGDKSKKRPKLPRGSHSGLDDYKPPPPTGGGGPDAPPPPPPPPPDADTFGDW